MSMADTLKSLVFKAPAKTRDSKPTRATARKEAVSKKKSNDIDNPYLTARRTWNEHVGSVISSRQTWQVIGILSMMIALGAVGGIIHIGSQSKFIPYVVEVDKLGGVRVAGPVTSTSRADSRIIHAAVADFIEDARIISPDAQLQRKAILSVYAHLAPNDPATVKMNEYMNGNEAASPFKRATKEMVSTEILSVLLQTPSTWQVDWKETVRDRQGVRHSEPAIMRALVTVYIADSASGTSEEEQIRNNPLNIYVRDFSWSRLR
jgi:type IV secretory pathway TrbF-like protein